MISIDNINYCEFCFEQMSVNDHFCTKCGSRYDQHRYPGTLPAGTLLKRRYIVGKVLGKGGFGITYLCFDAESKKRVAIKEYFPDGFVYRDNGTTAVQIKQSPDIFNKGAEKFFNEAKLLYNFNNIPNIVKIEKFFAENNTKYFVMEYLVGSDLKDYFKSVPHPDENLVIYIAIEVLKSLRILHAKNVLHRDIAPDNIFMCDDGTIKLIDFGAARVTSLTEVSSSFSVILKPGFAPFEQYQSKGKQGPWTDIYALGATMYYLIKKVRPQEAVVRREEDTLDMTGFSPQLRAILSKMMAVRIDERYNSADEVIADLTQTQRGGNNEKNPSPVDDIEPNNPSTQTIDTFWKKHSTQTIPKGEPSPKKENDQDSNKKLTIILLCIVSVLCYLVLFSLMFILFG